MLRCTVNASANLICLQLVYYVYTYLDMKLHFHRLATNKRLDGDVEDAT